MNVDLYFTVPEIEPAVLQSKTVVVVDVLRATSTIAEALANGARAVYPVTETEDAIKLASSLGRGDTVLCGERRGLKVEGYDLGNSPREFTEERVSGKQLVMSTTNGTRALVAVGGAARVLTVSFLNLSAVAGALAGVEELAVVCAGRDGRFAMEDTICGGLLLRKLHPVLPLEGVSDAARASHTLAADVDVDVALLAASDSGRALTAGGLEADLEVCADLDRHALVPELEEGRVGLVHHTP